jgi:hypothetical protein
MAGNKTDSRQWTSEKPTKSGLYYRQSFDEDPIVLKVDVLKVDVLDDREGHIRVVWLPGDNAAEPLAKCHGDWAGPIEPPS